MGVIILYVLPLPPSPMPSPGFAYGLRLEVTFLHSTPYIHVDITSTSGKIK